MPEDPRTPLGEVSDHEAGPYDNGLDALLVERGWTSMRPIKEDLYCDEWHWQPEKHPHPAQPSTIICLPHERVQVNLRYDHWTLSRYFQLGRAQLLETLDRIEAHG